MEALQLKVFPGTEAETFHDGFFQSQDMVVNALDNVEARRYVDRYIPPYLVSRDVTSRVIVLWHSLVAV